MKSLLLVFALIPLLPAQEAVPEPPKVEPIDPLEAQPSRDIFDLATLYYNAASETLDPEKKLQNYRLASRRFDRFIRSFPQDKKTIDAWYFLALCYRQLDEPEASKACFETIATRWDTGKYVAGSALHLARDHYEKKKWKSAAKWFRILARTTDNQKVRHESLYRIFICFNELQDQNKIRESLDAILLDPKTPFRETAKIALARVHQDAKDHRKAFTLFSQIASSQKPEIAGEATLQAAQCAQALNDGELSLIWFVKALEHPALREWRGHTQLSLMNLHYQGKSYREVVHTYEKGKFKLAPQPHLQRLIIAAKSYEAVNREKDALRLYQEISRLSPESDTGLQASYRILVHSHSIKNRNFAKKGEKFITRYQEKFTNDRRIHSARLLLAEHYFDQKDHHRALSHYQKLNQKLIDPTNRIIIRYHEAKCHLALNNNEQSLASIAAFQRDFPKSKQFRQLRLQRAELLTTLKRNTEAISDYQSILDDASDPKLKSIILQRLAAIYQENNNRVEFTTIQRQILLLPNISDQLKANAQFSLGVENFRLKKYSEAAQQLRIARKMFPHDFTAPAAPLLIRCAYQAGDLKILEAEITALRTVDSEAKVPKPIMQWLGATLSKKGQHLRAWPFLNESLKETESVTALIWKLYADSSLATKNHQEALRAAIARHELETHPFRKAEAFYQKSIAHQKLKQYDDARQATDDALSLRPEGELNLSLRIFAGDIEIAANQPQEALRHYIVVESLYAKTREQKIAVTKKLIAALKSLNSSKAQEQLIKYERSLTTLNASK